MNAMSSLVTRGCTEMGSMGKLFGADQETFWGLAGVGDTFGFILYINIVVVDFVFVHA